MNLWHLFPMAIMEIEYILYLPYAALAAYIYVLYATVAHKKQRKSLLFFLLLTIIATGTMILTLGPGIGRIIPPLLLLSVIVMPALTLLKKYSIKDNQGVSIWLKVTLSGGLHSLSWWVWLIALSRS